MKSTGNPELDAALRPQLQPMRSIDRDVGRYLAVLRNLIRGRGFTQLGVQDVLGWGRSYISQLMAKQKALRLEQVFLILGVIGVEPDAFFAEIYHHPPSSPLPRRGAAAALAGGQQPPQFPRAELHRFQALLGGLVTLLGEKGMFTATELTHAIKEAEQEP